jgi:hypothetical protein
MRNKLQKSNAYGKIEEEIRDYLFWLEIWIILLEGYQAPIIRASDRSRVKAKLLEASEREAWERSSKNLIFWINGEFYNLRV